MPGGDRVKVILFKDFPRYSKGNAALVNQVIEQFRAYGWLKNYHPGVRVESEIREIAHELRNPPPKDSWASVSARFRSKWWSVPIMVVVVALPAIYGYYEMIYKLCVWFGILKEGSLPSL